jgi:hypothetical protein
MVKSEIDQPDHAPPRRGRGRAKKAKEEDEYQDEDDEQLPQADSSNAAAGGVEVKTKFPVARIKRIMQADEDVGKVAQVTPVVVGEYPPPHPSLAHTVGFANGVFSTSSQGPRAFHDQPGAEVG